MPTNNCVCVLQAKNKKKYTTLPGTMFCHCFLTSIARCRDLKKYTTLPGTIVSYCSMKESVFFNTTLSQKKKETMRVAGLLLVFK
jgi:hypothetical protein